MAEPVRLQKFLSNAGIASRRKAEELISAGRVRVNGEIITELGTRVDPEQDRIEVDDERVQTSDKVWLALHKPPRVLTTRGDTHNRDTIYELLPREYRGLFYVGRLDYETEGLVILTNDGDGAQRLQHPRFEVRRVYEVEIDGTFQHTTRQQLLAGVMLDDGPARLLEVQVIRNGPPRATLRVSLAEGRKREVRRLFNAVNHEVLRLTRLSFGPVELGDLPVGQWRRLTDAEVAALDQRDG